MACKVEKLDYPRIMSRRYFFENDARFGLRQRLWGVGCREVMPPGHVQRRQGLGCYLAVLFHDQVEVELGGQVVRMEAERLVLWEPGRPHFFGRAEAPWSHSWVAFGGADWEAERPWLEPLCEHPWCLPDPEAGTAHFARLLREVETHERPDAGVIFANVLLVLREAGRQRERVTAGEDRVRAAASWIQAHLRESFGVHEVARRVGLSPSRLQQLFRARHGTSVQRFIEGQRMQEARYWLAHSGLRIGEVAERAGFEDAFYFARRFRKAFGQSPSSYRQAGAKPIERAVL
jgi:AraC family transcriptional regulator of arabinose operon